MAAENTTTQDNPVARWLEEYNGDRANEHDLVKYLAHRLFEKYPRPMVPDTCLYTEREVAAAVSEAIRYAIDLVEQRCSSRHVTWVVILEGGYWFASRVIYAVMTWMTSTRGQEMLGAQRVKFIRVSSYGNNVTPLKPKVDWGDLSVVDVQDRHVIVLDDMIDSGRTFDVVTEGLAGFGPRAVHFMALLSRNTPDVGEIDTGADTVWAAIHPLKHQGFVTGCGLDCHGQYRMLPQIWSTRREEVDLEKAFAKEVRTA